MSKKLQWVLVGIMMLVLLIFVITLKPVKINGIAMEPNYKNGEKFLALRDYLFNPTRGDVVTYKYSKFPEFTWVGRIVGLPKDRIVIKDGKIELNGQVLPESYLPSNTRTEVTDKAEYDRVDAQTIKNVTVKGVTLFKEGQELQVPTDSYFVLGDNRSQSVDSRGIGFVIKSDIKAKILFKY